MYDLVIKGGTVVDPSQGINEEKDVAISKGRVAEVASSISNAKRIVEAAGMFVTAGLIDLHAHVAHDVTRLCVDPDALCLPNGATTVVDAGSTGELNFRPFKRFVIDAYQTRILAFVNIESLGMIEFNDSPSNTDQRWPSLITAADDALAPLFANPRNLINLISRNKKDIVGIKWAHHGIKLLEIAREVADEAPCRIMAENHFMPEALKYLRRGDIITHSYHFHTSRLNHRRDGLTEDGKRIRPEIFQAMKRGIVLDVGHGKGSFAWNVAELALKEGLEPTTISTDLWIGNVDGPVFDMPTTMSKFLYLGMPFEKVVRASSFNPAAVLGLSRELGTLKPGAVADVSLMRIVEGRHPLVDTLGKGRMAERMIRAAGVVKSGRVVREPSS